MHSPLCLFAKAGGPFAVVFSEERAIVLEVESPAPHDQSYCWVWMHCLFWQSFPEPANCHDCRSLQTPYCVPLLQKPLLLTFSCFYFCRYLTFSLLPCARHVCKRVYKASNATFHQLCGLPDWMRWPFGKFHISPLDRIYILMKCICDTYLFWKQHLWNIGYMQRVFHIFSGWTNIWDRHSKMAFWKDSSWL